MQEFLRRHPWARSAIGLGLWFVAIPAVIVPAAVFGWPASAAFVTTAIAIGAAGLVEHLWLTPLRKEAAGNLTCSFCRLHQSQVAKLVAGPGVYICDQCIGLCMEIITDAPPGEEQGTTPLRPPTDDDTDVWAPPQETGT